MHLTTNSNYMKQKNYRNSGRDRQIHNYSQRCQYPLSVIDWTSQQKISKDFLKKQKNKKTILAANLTLLTFIQHFTQQQNTHSFQQHMFPNHSEVKVGINKRKILLKIPKYLETNTLLCNLWDKKNKPKEKISILNWMKIKTQYIKWCDNLLKQYLKRTFIALNAFIRKKKSSQINGLSVHPKKKKKD